MTKLRLYARLLSVAGLVIAIDQFTKSLALGRLADRPEHLIPGVLSLNLSFNSGGAFGLLQGVPWLFLVAGIGIIALILVWAGRVDEEGYIVPLGLVLGGGTGNLIDRVARDFNGQVVDFIDLHVWPVFNFADMAIAIGVGLIILAGFRRRPEERDTE